PPPRMPHPLVAVIMGSSSDWETMQHTVDVLEQFGVEHERHIVSAHRTPVWMAEFATGAEARGVEVIIAGAGGAAHLPGMVAAHRMGYRVHTFSPEIDTPTGQAADVEVVADYEDLDALRAFARQVDVVTFEFENVPIDAVDAIESITPVRPCGMALHTAQQRAREKQFLADRGFPTAAFGRAASLDELWDAVARVGTPSVIKTAAFGYDGKGQHKVTTPADVEHIWTAIGHQEAVVE